LSDCNLSVLADLSAAISETYKAVNVTALTVDNLFQQFRLKKVFWVQVCALCPISLSNTCSVIHVIRHYLHFFQTHFFLVRARSALLCFPTTTRQIDAEGYDPAVLRGAASSLSAGAVDVLWFEYHSMGLWNRHRLADVTAGLDAQGYSCFLMSTGGVWLLTGSCWSSEFEINHWSDIACVHGTRPEILDALYPLSNIPHARTQLV
jgi:hypothetical protein